MLTQVVDERDPVFGATLTWIRALSERVERLHLIALAVGEAALPDNCRLFSLGKERGAGRLTKLAGLQRHAARLLGRGEAQGVFIHQNQRYGPLLAPWTRPRRVPVVLFKAHGHLPWSVRLCLPFIDRVVTSSQKGFAIDTPKRVVLGQAIDCGLFRPPQGGERERGATPRLCSVGRISPAKGYETLIAAAARLAGEGWGALTVDIYGACATREDEAYLAGLRAQVERLGLTGRVRFRGPVPHARLPERLAGCDLFVNLSATDSLDKAVLEAMACERPVLSSNLSCRELLEAHSPLLGFERGDDAALAARIKDLWNVPGAELARLGRGLRETVARDHGLGRFMDQLIGLFEELRAG